MSWHATAWVKDLQACPDGARLTRGQKLLLFVLADYHNTAQKFAWPSVLTLASEALLSVSQTKRDLSYLEEHCVIQRCRPKHYGKGHMNGYKFLALDDPTRLAELLLKRVHGDPLSDSDEKGSERVQIQSQKGSKRVHFEAQKGSERVQNGTPSIEQRTIEQEQELNEEQHAEGVLNPVIQRSLTAWIAAKDDLRALLGAGAWSLWIRPAKLLNVFSEKFLLVALPPNNRVMEAARANKQVVQEVLLKRDYALAGFTTYPDEWTKEELALRYPRIAATMLGRASGDG